MVFNNADGAYVILGIIGAPYGVRGWNKVTSFTAPVANLLSYAPWYLERDSGWQQVKPSAGRTHGKSIVVKFSGTDTPEQAGLLTGKKIAVLRSQLPALNKNEYYWRDLEGLTVINQHKTILGQVINILETGSNDVLVIKGEKEHAIPFLLDEVILKIDLENKLIHVNWELI